MTTISERTHLTPLSPSGSNEARWATGQLQGVPKLNVDPTDFDRLVLLAAHAHEESLGAAGLLNTFSAAGVDIAIAIASLSEDSHPFSLTHSRAELAQLRRAEVSRAMRSIAPSAEVLFLALPSGDLDFHMDAFQSTVERLSSFGGRVLIVTPARAYGDGDHAMVRRCAASAAQAWGADLLEYPLQLWDRAGPDDTAVPWEDMRRLPLTVQQRRLKAFAMECHRSQWSDLSEQPGDEAVLSPATMAHFARSFEVFLDPAGRFR